MKYSLFGLLLLLLLSCSQEHGLNDEVELKDVGATLNQNWDLYEAHKASNPDSALFYMQEVKALAETAGNSQWIAASYVAIGDVHRKKSNFGESTYHYLRAIKLFKDLGELKRLAVVYTSLSLIYESIEDFEQAIFYSLKAKDIFFYEGNSYDKANIYRNLALYHSTLKQFEEAEEYIYLAEKVAFQAQDHNILSKIYNTIGVLSFKQENYDKAREFYKKTIQFSDSLPDSQWTKVAATSNIGEAYFHERNYAQAEKWLKNALAIPMEVKDPLLRQATLNIFGEMLIEQGKYRECIDLLQNNFSQTNLTKTNTAVEEGLGLVQEALTHISEEARPENADYLSRNFATLNSYLKVYTLHARQLREELQTLSKQYSVQANVTRYTHQEEAEKAAQKTFQIMMIAAFLLISALVAIFMVMAKNRRYKTLYGKVADILNSQALRHMKKG